MIPEQNHVSGFVIVGGGGYGCGFQLGCGGNGAPSLPQIGTEYRNEFSPDVLCLFETESVVLVLMELSVELVF
ncbi:hypothetical protein Goshw_021518 [Gossypium schwendimanii]|uniref:Uncharacterized protein n=1 Tax=Gossypium schwendimanii TaxID=34291 RepID=A0A7J9MDD8_GOSSC|nr:hypothetical protein [Gossypium schwendimanii]